MTCAEDAVCCVESNAARAVGLNGVPVLLTMFSEWHKSDNRNRHIALRKSVLSVLKNVTNLSQSSLCSILFCFLLSLIRGLATPWTYFIYLCPLSF